MQRLGFAAVTETEVLSQVMSAISAPHQVVKVLISRGEGARGYGTAGIVQPQIFSWCSALPDYSSVRQSGVRLGLANLRLSRQPLLAGIKHCSRLETVLLKREAEQSHYDDLIASDCDGFAIEATAANLLVWRDQRWITPELSFAGVAGVMRQLLLKQNLLVEARLPIVDLERVDAMALCNALMGIVPVASYAGRALDLKPALGLQQQIDVFLQEP